MLVTDPLMTRAIYSLLLIFLCPLLPIYLLARGRSNRDYRLRWNERFGLGRLRHTDLLIHCASMGETLAAKPLIKQLLDRYPDKTMTITSSSPTGSRQVTQIFADEIASGRIQHCYLPFDVSFMTRHFVQQVSASTCIIMETELWPNLIHYSAKFGSQIIIANGRLSEKSFLQYQKHSKLFQPLLRQISALAVQTEVESERFSRLGINPQRLHVCGSLKFDIQLDDNLADASKALRKQWNKDKVWVAASVHPGEFQTIIRAHRALLKQHPNALLIMVPRHPEQFGRAAVELSESGMRFVRRTSGESVEPSTQILLADTMGEMLTWYGTADIAFIGGTLIKHGGHNPLEAAAMGVPVITGCNYRDFLEITELLHSAKHLQTVQNEADFAPMLTKLITDADYLIQAGKGGLTVVEENRGALQRQLGVIEAQLNDRH